MQSKGNNIRNNAEENLKYSQNMKIKQHAQKVLVGQEINHTKNRK